ncbi:hypothetical protein, partial [Pseudomonas abietaniphila]|uniref:hypothetical protein n=1 Tax=Pseudomonas abietaniphila TaxID=89065 RepID=UPI001EE70A4B
TPQSLNKTCGSQLADECGLSFTFDETGSPHREQTDCSDAPRGNTLNDVLRHPGCGVCCQALRLSKPD